MEWARILAYITGTVDQDLLLRDEYLAAENRILKAQLQGRLRLSDAERVTLGEIGHRLGRKALGEAATAALPDTIWGGTEGSSPANSMDRVHVEPWAGRQSAKKSRS
jgi:putative transposase